MTQPIASCDSFLGLANFYQRFISHYALIASPLYELTHKDTPVPFKLTDNVRSVVALLKDAFQSASILIHHDPSKPMVLFTDASDFAISGIPHQADNNGKLHPLCFFSRKLTDAEINYDVVSGQTGRWGSGMRYTTLSPRE